MHFTSVFELNKPAESSGVSTTKLCFQRTHVGVFLFYWQKNASILLQSGWTKVSLDANTKIKGISQREQISWLSFPVSPNLKSIPHDTSENTLFLQPVSSMLITKVATAKKQGTN